MRDLLMVPLGLAFGAALVWCAIRQSANTYYGHPVTRRRAALYAVRVLTD